MNKEAQYSKIVNKSHIKQYGQFFTDNEIADFMVKWACSNAATMLDPAIGNSVFFKYAKKHAPDCSLHGYEIDPYIIDFFGNPTNANIVNADYLECDWNSKFDAIVCNPPYNRFQSIPNRNDIIRDIFLNTGIKCSGYTNLYILFLIKSISQMSCTGRLAYIIPSEFLNSKYGTQVKDILINKHLLKAVINFKNDGEIFKNVTTTCCILLLDQTPKDSAYFYNLDSQSQLKNLTFSEHEMAVPYTKLIPAEKWRPFFEKEQYKNYRNLKKVRNFIYSTRGIATGANEYFCFSKSNLSKKQIPDECVQLCVSRSADIIYPILTKSIANDLELQDKVIYLLDIDESKAGQIKEYIDYGKSCGIDKKYLPLHRSPWYSMEQKAVAPIWISSACRNTIKVVRNLANISTLTTFHLVFVNENFKNETDVIFCYLLTPIAQELLKRNKKALGNGLDKFQPSDINNAEMLDITLLSPKDRATVLSIYEKMKSSFSDTMILELNEIFKKYLY